MEKLPGHLVRGPKPQVMTAVSKWTVPPFANSVLKIAVAGFARNFAITILNVESNDVHCMQDLESDLVERQPLYALPVADIDPSERPNPPTAVGERQGDFPTAELPRDGLLSRVAARKAAPAPPSATLLRIRRLLT